MSGPGGVGKTLAARAISDEGGARPRSTSVARAPRRPLFALTQCLYSARKLGPIGAVAQSFGIFWIVLFDCLLGGSPAHTRAVHFSQVLSHARRALRLQQQRQAADGGRLALVVLDHYGTVLEAHPGGGGAGGGEGRTTRRWRAGSSCGPRPCASTGAPTSSSSAASACDRRRPSGAAGAAAAGSSTASPRRRRDRGVVFELGRLARRVASRAARPPKGDRRRCRAGHPRLGSMGHAAARRGGRTRAALGPAPRSAGGSRLRASSRLELVRGHGRQDVRSHGRAVALRAVDSDAQPREPSVPRKAMALLSPLLPPAPAVLESDLTGGELEVVVHHRDRGGAEPSSAAAAATQ